MQPRRQTQPQGEHSCRIYGRTPCAENAEEEDIDSPEVVRKYFNTYRTYLGDGTDKVRVVEAFERIRFTA